MFKHSLSLLVAMFATTTLAGCELYFGDHHDRDGDSWTYCGQDGYYECNGDDCYWRGPECPDGTQPPPGGFECQSSDDCAAGCYCDNGVCNEAGFCKSDEDCGAGYVCNEQRSSCEPAGGGGSQSCIADSDCAKGEYCDSATLKCTETCICTTDAEAKAQGFDYCDDYRQTCLPGVDPLGDCDGQVTCNQVRPTCPEGQVALISEGCYTGQCQAINTCALEPTCSSLQHESDCSGNGSCTLNYTGINCRNPDNTPCTAGSSSSCVCESFQFAYCSGGTSP